MPKADAVTIWSHEQRKAAVLRAAQLLSSSRVSDGEREFEVLVEAIADFDIRQYALGFIEIRQLSCRSFQMRKRAGFQAAVAKTKRGALQAARWTMLQRV